jgi:hypothetical protein
MALPFVLILLAGCDPQDATVTGQFAMYFAQATSSNILRVQQDYAPVSCDYALSDPLDKSLDDLSEKELREKLFVDEPCWEERVAAEAQFEADYNLTPFDCRTFGGSPYNDNGIRIRDTLIPGWETQYEDFCCEEAFDDDDSNDPDGNIFTADDCTVRRGRYSTFMTEKAFYLHQGQLDGSYRQEAILTAEGDLQLTVHVDTQFGDMRFGWVIDPDFAPTECVEVDGKAVERSLFDDGNWIDGWSKDDPDGMTVYHLNAGSVQANPNKVDDYWYFHRSWSAGAGFSRFGDEDAYMFSSDYIDYAVDSSGNYSVSPMWVGRDDAGKVVSGYGNYGTEQYTELNCGDGDSCSSFKDYDDFYESMVDNFNNGGEDKQGNQVIPVDRELEALAGLSYDEFPFHVRMEDNSWRTTVEGEGTDAAGFDGWTSANPNWVRFDWSREELAAITTGNLSKPLKGEFQLYMYSSDNTGSVWFYQGEFEITHVGEDVWGYEQLEDITREKNDTPECGE